MDAYDSMPPTDRSAGRRALLVLLLLLLAPLPLAAAQSSLLDSYGTQNFRPEPPLRPPPDLAFLTVADLALPGPLPGPGPVDTPAGLAVAVAGGLARIDAGTDAAAVDRTSAVPTALDPTAWVVSPDGRFRARALPLGRIQTQHRCVRCRRERWKSEWSLRVAGGTASPPVVTDDRVYFGATDNRVYAVRRRNGHRLWDTDVGGRVVRSPVIWSYAPGPADVDADDQAPAAAEVEPLPLLLVVPGDGSSVVVLEADTGRRVTSWRLPENGGGLVGKPLPLDGERIALARQKYQEDEASLLVLRLAPGAKPVSERRSAPGPR